MLWNIDLFSWKCVGLVWCITMWQCAFGGQSVNRRCIRDSYAKHTSFVVSAETGVDSCDSDERD